MNTLDAPAGALTDDECAAIGADGRDGRGWITEANLTDAERAALAAYRAGVCEGYNVAGKWVDCTRPMPHGHGIVADGLPAVPGYRTITVWVGDAGPYEAMVAVDAAGEYDRWNGWVAGPTFDRPTVDRIAAMLDADHADGADSDYITWDGDVAVVHSRVYANDPGYAPERIAPDANGRYSIGGWSWVWSEWNGDE